MLKGWWREIAAAVDAGRLTLVTSPHAIDEFVDVTARPRLTKLIHPSDSAEIADLLRRAELYRPVEIPAVCRDPSDDYLLALALSSAAAVLVTRDEDLLSLRQVGVTEIIHVAEFLTRLEANR